MQPPLAPLLERFTPSPIAQMVALAARMRAEGRELFDFSTGEPDFDTPEPIKRAAIAAIERGETKYSPTDGTLAVKAAVARKFARDNALAFDLDEIVVANGAKPLLADMVRTMAGDGDEVVLAAPAWPSHVGMIEIAGARAVLVPADQASGFRMGPEALDAAMTPRTRAVLLCSPGNPSGAVYGRDDLDAIAAVLRRHPQVWAISDDLYEHIVFDGRRFATMQQVAPDLAGRCVTVNGVSKAYAMTGWRIGYAGGPRRLMDALRKVMSQAAGCPSSVSEAAAIAALDSPLDDVHRMVATYEARRNRTVRALNQMPGLACTPPQGAFYLYPSCAGLIGLVTPAGKTIASSSDFCRYLLEDFLVAVVPGPAFGLDPHFRLSIATADATIDAGLAAIARAVSSLKDKRSDPDR